MRLFVALIAVSFAWPALSEPITVKSGDHSEFTRLVVYLQNNQSWALSETDDLTTLSIENWTQGFDVSDVFRRIGNQRLKSITASDDSLVMSLGCTCEILTEELGQGLLSLDIREVSARALTLRQSQRGESALPEVVDFDEPVQEEIAWPIVFDSPTVFLKFDDILDRQRDIRMTEFGQTLGSEIARSATLTYLAPSGVELHGSAKGNLRRKSKSQKELLEELGNRARFSNSGTKNTRKPEELENSCPSQNDFAVSKWGGSSSFAEQLAAMRSDLYTEFDQLNVQGVRDLVRFYVHYGLKPEVELSIKTFSDQPDLAGLSELVDVVSSNTPDQPRLAALTKCGGETGFWSVIATMELHDSSQPQVENLVGVFRLLPRHLQELTGDRLVSLFAESGFLSASGVVRNILDRTQNLSSDLATFSQEKLLSLVDQNNELSPEALVVFVENALSSGAEVSVEMIELVGAYVHQLDGTEIAKRLLSMQVLALADRSEITEAMALLFKKEDADLIAPIELRTKLIRIVLSKGQPSEVAELSWKLESRDALGSLPEPELLEVSDFLNKRGMPQLALIVLRKIEDRDASVNIRAEALARSGRGEEARKLISESPDQTMGPRLSEFFLVEDPELAWAQRERLTGVAGENVAWVSGNWLDVVTKDVRDDLSKLIIAAQQEVSTSDKPIQDAQTAFSDSETARRVLDELLN